MSKDDEQRTTPLDEALVVLGEMYEVADTEGMDDETVIPVWPADVAYDFAPFKVKHVRAIMRAFVQSESTRTMEEPHSLLNVKHPGNPGASGPEHSAGSSTNERYTDKPSDAQIEAFRNENFIHAHIGETPDAGLEAWAVESNMVLDYLCGLARAMPSAGTSTSDFVAWCRFVPKSNPARFEFCDREDSGAFQVFGTPQSANTSTTNEQRMIDAEEACIDVFNDFDESEVRKETRSVQIAWEIGRLRALTDREMNK